MEDMLNTFQMKHEHPIRDLGAACSLLPYKAKSSIFLPKTTSYFFLTGIKQLFFNWPITRLIFQITISIFIFGVNCPFYHWNELLGCQRFGNGSGGGTRRQSCQRKGWRDGRGRSQWNKSWSNREQIEGQSEEKRGGKVWEMRRKLCFMKLTARI